MNEIQTFNNPEFGTVRAVRGDDGEPMFVAKDVCAALGLGNSRQALARLDDDEKGVISTDTPGGEQQMQAVNEPGLYVLVLSSRKPEARAFKRWVTHEVLPALRRDGGYMVARADETPEELMARALKAADATLARVRDENARLTRRNQVLEPKAAFFDSVMESDGLISVRAAAKVLKSYDREMGERRLRQMLRDACYLEKRTRSATAAAIGRGYMKERPFAITHSDGRREMDHYGCLTPKGLAMCARRFCGQAALPGMG
ncbi:BRO family protein [Paratractidigestivibacter faecalis]|uniref:BRO family protein n=1 Tax=Paratractidigestivibacter faecalis TaxID=2292441 RepID=UPI003F9BA92C